MAKKATKARAKRRAQKYVGTDTEEEEDSPAEKTGDSDPRSPTLAEEILSSPTKSIDVVSEAIQFVLQGLYWVNINFSYM